MGIPDPAAERYLMIRARQHADDLLSSFRAGRSDEEEVSALCTRAGVVFDQYGDGLLEALRAAIDPADESERKWLRQHYLPLLVEFATALRDTIADSATRHAAAQAIQCKVLEHERHLRLVLDTPAPTVLAAVVADAAAVPTKPS